jgi:hypothetical protein
MLYFILAEADNTTLLGVGAVLAILQIAGMIFKRHGEPDSRDEDVKELTVTLQETRTKLEAAFKSMDRDRDTWKEGLKELKRNIESLDRHIRGNGHDGILTRMTKIEGDLGNIKTRLELMTQHATASDTDR